MTVADPFVRFSRRLLRKALMRVRTSVIAHIETYDAASQSASVTALVPEQDTVEGVPRDLRTPTYHNVPVAHLGSSKRGLTFGLEEGDPVLLIARHRSHQEVDQGAEGPVSPANCQRMALSEGIALPGYVPPGQGQPDAHQREDGQPVLYMDAGEALHIAVSTASIALARADQVQQQFNDLKAWADAHYHAFTGVAVGSPAITTPPALSPTGLPPDLSPTPPDVATSRVLVDS